MEKKTNNILLTIAAVIITLMMGVMFFQNKTLDKYKALLKEEADTVISVDTCYLDRFITDTIPTISYQTILKVDTCYFKDSLGNISAEPQLISLKKKKSKMILD